MESKPEPIVLQKYYEIKSLGIFQEWVYYDFNFTFRLKETDFFFVLYSDGLRVSWYQFNWPTVIQDYVPFEKVVDSVSEECRMVLLFHLNLLS